MTKKLMVGKVAVGGGAPVSIQSMCNTKTDDVAATVAQIHALEDAGCEIIRVAVPDEDAAKAVDKIKEQIDISLIADIHFNYKLALMCAERGIDALRINPGNIGGEEKVKAVADICRQKNIPIRIGVNGGSLEKELRAKYGGVTAEALVESAMGHVRLLNRFDFDDICISVKCSDVPLTMRAYTLLSQQTDYPLHLGVTEAGTPSMGMVKSAMGIGGLLCMGIGDTIRVTLTAGGWDQYDQFYGQFHMSPEEYYERYSEYPAGWFGTESDDSSTETEIAPAVDDSHSPSMSDGAEATSFGIIGGADGPTVMVTTVA